MTDDEVKRLTVRVLDDVGEVFGVDGQDYELQKGDIADLPAVNAEALLERGAAERADDVPDDQPELTGPPEPVVTDDDVSIMRPTADGRDVRSVDLGTWECQRCGSATETTVVNGEVQEPHECAGCERQGPFLHRGLPESAEITPSSFADPSWPTPSSITDEGYADLWSDVRDWIYTNWVTDEEHLYDGLTAFAISTWLRPNFNFLPQLMVMGKHETGKTRLLTTLARVSYRARTPVSFTPAALFRTVDKYDISLFLSEYHDLNDDLRDEVNAVIKGSQKRGEDVMRVEKGPASAFEPVDFDIFTHVAIGTQFDPPDDIVSRCIKIQTRPADRDVPPWFDEDRAEDLRNRLLYARYRLLDSDAWDEAERRSLEWLNDRDISGRLREKLLSLVTVADLWDKRGAIEAFVEAMEDEATEAAADSDDALVIQAIVDLALAEVQSVQTIGDADPWEGLEIPVSNVRDRFEAISDRDDISSRYIGQIRKRLGLEKQRGRDGVVIRDADLEEKLRTLCEENNLPFARLDVHERVRELDETYKGTCSECNQVKQVTHRDAVEGHHICGTCAAELEGELDSPGSASNGTHSQRDRVQQVYEFVDRNGPVEPATVADELELSSDVVRHDIDNLKHSGDLYSPDGDEVETT